MAVHDSRVRNLTAWRLTNDRTTPGQKANIATEFAGRDVPKMKFLFTVSFEFGKTLQGISSNPDFDSTLQFKPNPGSDEMASIEYACKNVARPNINVNYVEVNSYNYRYKVATRTDVGTVTLTLYDDNKNTAHHLFSEYLAQISPVAKVPGGDAYYLKENIQEWASLGPLPTEEADGLIRKMRVTHHFPENNSLSASNYARIHYDYVNPKIQSFGLDELDMSTSDVNMITLTFVYDSVNVVYDGAAAPRGVNGGAISTTEGTVTVNNGNTDDGDVVENVRG